MHILNADNYLVFYMMNGHDDCCVMSLDYNKTWFSTKAEAEKALEEMEK